MDLFEAHYSYTKYELAMDLFEAHYSYTKYFYKKKSVK